MHAPPRMPSANSTLSSPEPSPKCISQNQRKCTFNFCAFQSGRHRAPRPLDPIRNTGSDRNDRSRSSRQTAGSFATGYEIEPNTPSKIAVIPIDGGVPVKLFDVAPTAIASSVVWRPDGRSLVYVDTRDGVSNLRSQPLDGGQPARLSDFRSDRIYCFDFSGDGRQLALARGDKISNVVLFSNLK
jgi:hypothetical protein